MAGALPVVIPIGDTRNMKNAFRSERSSKVTSVMKQTILNDVRKDRHEREKSSAMLDFDHKVSSFTILRILQRNEFRACKSTKKSDLSVAMKKTRLRFCIEHRD